MPQPLRKKTQHQGDQEAASGHILRISGLTAMVWLGLLTAVVAWAFFMGFTVGRGQSPSHHVEAMTGLLQKESPVPLTPQQPADTLSDSDMPAGEVSAPGQEALPAVAPVTEPAHSPPAPQADALPFARPSGEGLAAWGIRPAVPADGARTEAPDRETKAALPSPAQALLPEESLYDFVFQTAAFRNRADADALRSRLEDRGLRSRVAQSGKVHLVMVHLRGSQREANNLIEELQRMKLGKPIQHSRKAAPAPRGHSIR